VIVTGYLKFYDLLLLKSEPNSRIDIHKYRHTSIDIQVYTYKYRHTSIDIQV